MEIKHKDKVIIKEESKEKGVYDFADETEYKVVQVGDNCTLSPGDSVILCGESYAFNHKKETYWLVLEEDLIKI